MYVDNVYVLYEQFWKITKLSFFFFLTPSTKKFVISAILFFLLYGYILCKALNDFDDFSSNTKNSITIILDRIVVLVNTVLLILSTIVLYKHEAKVKHIQFLLNDFDACLRKHAVVFNTRKKAQRTVNLLIITFGITLMYYIGKTIFLSVHYEQIKWILIIQVIYKYINTFTLTSYNILTSFVYWRLLFLNKYIKSHYSVPVTKISAISNVDHYIDWKTQEYQLSVDTKTQKVKHVRNSITLSRILHHHLRNIVDIFYASAGKFYVWLVLIVVVEQLKCLLHIFIVLRLYYAREELYPLAWFFCFSDLCFGYLSQFALMLYIINLLQVEVGASALYSRCTFY